MNTLPVSTCRRNAPFYALAFLAALAVATFAAGCSNKSSQAAERGNTAEETIPVTLVPVKIEQTALPVRAMGALATKDEMKLSFKIGGVIESVAAREGESVRKGQTLASLNPTEINAQVAQARQAFDKAERDWERVKTLRAENAVSVEQFQNASTGYEMAKSALQIAQFNRNHAVIASPIDGKVLKTLAKQGEITGAGMPVLVVSSESSGWVIRAGLSDRDIVRLNVGDKAAARFDAFPGRTFEAKVNAVSAAANPANGTFEVELLIAPQSGARFVTGLAASVEILPSARDTVAMLPIEALAEASGMAANVYAPTADGSKARKIAVRVAFVRNEAVAVKAADLKNVLSVVAEGSAYLTDGAAIKVIKQTK